MAHTNSTANYHLPQFISTDKPAWLTDVNAAYSDIDVGMKNAQDAATSAQTDATQALTDSASAMSTATQADAKASGAIASLAATFSDTSTYSVGDYVIYNNILYKCTVAVTVPGPWSGTLNWERASINNIVADLESYADAQVDGLTAADVEYASNVSVADKIVELDASVAIAPFTITPKANISLGNVQAFKFGKLRIISLYFRSSVATSSIFSVSSDNKPQDYIYAPLGMQQGVTHDAYGYLDTNGDFGTNASIVANKLYTINLSYIVA